MSTVTRTTRLMRDAEFAGPTDGQVKVELPPLSRAEAAATELYRSILASERVGMSGHWFSSAWAARRDRRVIYLKRLRMVDVFPEVRGATVRRVS